MYSLLFSAPKNLTVFSLDYETVVVPFIDILMSVYILIAAVLLMNLLIARFAYVYSSVYWFILQILLLVRL